MQSDVEAHITHTFNDLTDSTRCEFEVTSYWALQFHAMRQVMHQHAPMPVAGGNDDSDGRERGSPTRSESGRVGGSSAAWKPAAQMRASDLEFSRSLSVAIERERGAGRSDASFYESLDGRFLLKVKL